MSRDFNCLEPSILFICTKNDKNLFKWDKKLININLSRWSIFYDLWYELLKKKINNKMFVLCICIYIYTSNVRAHQRPFN